MALQFQNGRSIDELPVDAVTNIMVLLGTESARDVMKCKILSKTFNAACETDEVYRAMETKSLTSVLYCDYESVENALQRCRAAQNPNIYYHDGMNRYFYVIDDSGLDLLEEASLDGSKDATFVLGMLMLAEGEARKPQALQLLNAAYPHSSTRMAVIQETMRQVELMLARRWKRNVTFHACQLTCTQHPQGGTDHAYIISAPWVFECDVCLWEACLMRFERMFDADMFWD